MEIKDIEKLAKLARIDLTETEKTQYLKEMVVILGYVDQIKGVVAKIPETFSSLNIKPNRSEKVSGILRNVMRSDEVKNESGTNTEAIVAEFPRKEENYLKVKKIL